MINKTLHTWLQGLRGFCNRIKGLLPLMQRAGIYLHTHGLTAPFCMPISIAEAMGTGAYIIGRKCPASEEFIGDAGALYDAVDEAVELVQATTRWTDADWQRTQARSVERAFEQFTDRQVYSQMLDDWLAIAARRQAAKPPVRMAA